MRSTFWVTAGGQMRDGEDVLAAAKRELEEETGLSDASIGPAVWYGEKLLNWKGDPTLLQETFVVATTHDIRVSGEQREPEESSAIMQSKWWTLQELKFTRETIIPGTLRELLPPIIDLKYPEALQVIDLSPSR